MRTSTDEHHNASIQLDLRARSCHYPTPALWDRRSGTEVPELDKQEPVIQGRRQSNARLNPHS